MRNKLSDPCCKALSTLLIYLLISTAFTEWPGSVLKENLSGFVKALVFFYFTVLIVDSNSRLKFLITIFILSQIFRVVEPLFLHITTGYWGSSTYIGSGEFAGRLGGAPSDVINPNGLGFVIATLFAYTHYLWGTSSRKFKLFYYILTPVIFYALILTMSRSAFIAVLIVSWTIFKSSSRKFVMVIVGLVIVVVAWGNMSDLQKERYLSLTGSDKVQGASTVTGRITGMKSDLRIALNRPIIGHGVGTSLEAKYHGSGHAKISHNFYLEIIIETGFIGFFLFLKFLKSIYMTIQATNKKIFEMDQDNISKYDYEIRLMKALNACFWMYVVFSFAQYGVSEYHWYLLAGLAIILNRDLLRNSA